MSERSDNPELIHLKDPNRWAESHSRTTITWFLQLPIQLLASMKAPRDISDPSMFPHTSIIEQQAYFFMIIR